MNWLRPLGLPESRSRELTALLRGVDKGVLLKYGLLVTSQLPAIAQARSLSPVYSKMTNDDSTFRFFGTDFLLGLEFFSGVREMYCRKVYNFLPSMRIGPNDVCVDLGANAGLFSLMAAKLGQKVVSVEAQSGFIPVIQENLRKNQCLIKAEVLHALIGASTGIFASDENRKKASHFSDVPESVQMEEILERCGGAIDFMKIDIEGSEFALFSGDTSWLAHVRRIAMEVHPTFGRPSELIKTLSAYGFHTLATDAVQEPLADIEKADYIYASKDQLLSL